MGNIEFKRNVYYTANSRKYIDKFIDIVNYKEILKLEVIKKYKSELHSKVKEKNKDIFKNFPRFVLVNSIDDVKGKKGFILIATEDEMKKVVLNEKHFLDIEFFGIISDSVFGHWNYSHMTEDLQTGYPRVDIKMNYNKKILLALYGRFYGSQKLALGTWLYKLYIDFLNIEYRKYNYRNSIKKNKIKEQVKIFMNENKNSREIAEILNIHIRKVQRYIREIKQ